MSHSAVCRNSMARACSVLGLLPLPWRIKGRDQGFWLGKTEQAFFFWSRAAFSCPPPVAAAHSRRRFPSPNTCDERRRFLRWRRRRETPCGAGDFFDVPPTRSIDRAFFRNRHSQTRYFPPPAPLWLV